MIRLSVNINEATERQMRLAALRYDISHTEVIRRALAAYTLLDEATQEGKTIHLRRGGLDWQVVGLNQEADPDGTVHERVY